MYNNFQKTSEKTAIPDVENTFVNSLDIKEVKKAAFELDKLLKNFSIKIIENSGKFVLEKIIWLYGEECQVEDLSMFRSLGYKTITRAYYCEEEDVVEYFNKLLEIMLQCSATSDLFLECLHSLTGIIYARTKNRIDPRKEAVKLKSVINLVGNSYDAQKEETKAAILTFIEASCKDNRLLIEANWRELYGNESLVNESMKDKNLIFTAVKLLKTVSEDSCGILKQAIEEPERYYTENLAVEEGIAIHESLVMLNQRVQLYEEEASEEYTFDELLSTYEAVLRAINWYNIRPPIKQLLLINNSEKIEIMLLKSLKNDLSDMYTFNQYKKGSYYEKQLEEFKGQFFDSLLYTIEYLEKCEDIWYYFSNQNQSSKNPFSALTTFEHDFTEEGILLNIELLGCFLSVNPSFPIIIDLLQFEEEYEEYIDEESNENYILLMLRLLGNAVENDKLSEYEQNFNLHLLEEFIAQFEFGLNLTLGVLSKTPENPTVNYEFLYYLVCNELKELSKEPTITYINEILNTFYEDYVLFAIKQVLYSVNYVNCSPTFYNIIYHVPIEILHLLNDEDLLQLQNLTLEACKVVVYENYSEYEESRSMYALQTLLRIALDTDLTDFIEETEEFMMDALQSDKIAANVKKPLLENVGMLIQRGKCNEDLINVIIQISSKENRSESTALRVIGILFEQTSSSLTFTQYANIELNDCIELCLSSSRSKNSIFISAVIALRELFETIHGCQNAELLIVQSEIFETFKDKVQIELEWAEEANLKLQNVNSISKLLLQIVWCLSEFPIVEEDVNEFINELVELIVEKKYFADLKAQLYTVLKGKEVYQLLTGVETKKSFDEILMREKREAQMAEYMTMYLTALPEDEKK